jgi:membrane-bound lytic murein transglycosylase D
MGLHFWPLRARLVPLVCIGLLGAGLVRAQIYPPPAPPEAIPWALAEPQNNGLQALSPQAGTDQAVAPLATTTDLWERIRRGYAMPDLDSPLVRDRETWYTARPDYIFRMTERSRKYLFHIVEELELRNMPTELALLPFVESAFNPQAVSSAKAAGMWQFMPATGKSFELKQNVFRDDRRDVLASTRAALDYLQRLYGMFGDWHLALAAYNWGEGSVGRAIAKNERQMRGTGYTDLTMPMETQFYVPKLQAIKNIVARPQSFGSELPSIGNHPYFKSVNIRRDIDVTLAAKLAEVPLDDFKALNPSLNKPVILAAGTPQILLPWDSADVFLQNLDRLAGSRLASWTVWVAPGTLRVADAAKQVGMGEAQLREINNIPKGVLIKPGSTLLVTRSAHGEFDVSEAVADRGEVGFAPEIVRVRKTVRAAKGDSVASIAKRYATTPSNVAQWNKVAANASFKAGQNVVVFVAGSTASTKAKSSARTSSKAKKRTTAKKPRSTPAKKSKA